MRRADIAAKGFSKEHPTVSIVCITYNQEKYIARAIESFLAQQLNGSMEIIIADDHSTDRTRDIIIAYAAAHPDVIKLILREHNVGAQKNFVETLQTARGTYVALCDGDDYWTDHQKLQLQVGFLNSHPDYALCFHLVEVIYEDNSQPNSVYPDPVPESFTISQLLKSNFIQTNSVLYRRKPYDDLPTDIMPGDIYLHLYHAQFGKIGFINRTMSVYLRHASGIWWDSKDNQDNLWRKYSLQHLGLFVELKKIFGKQAKYRDPINTSIASMFTKMIDLDKKYQLTLLKTAFKLFPQATQDFIIDQVDQKEKLEATLQVKAKTISDLEQEVIQSKRQVEVKDSIIAQKDLEITHIKASRVWRARNKLAKLVGREVI